MIVVISVIFGKYGSLAPGLIFLRFVQNPVNLYVVYIDAI